MIYNIKCNSFPIGDNTLGAYGTPKWLKMAHFCHFEPFSAIFELPMHLKY